MRCTGKVNFGAAAIMAIALTAFIINAENTADSDSPGADVNSADTVITADSIAIDTVNTGSIDIAAADSTGTAVDSAAAAATADSTVGTAVDSAKIAAAAPKIDTTLFTGTFLGFGASLAIGSTPLFAMWQNSLPMELQRFGITWNFGSDITPDDAAPLRCRVVESPDQFNFTLPFSVSIHNIKESSAISFALSFSSGGKQFQSVINLGADTLGRRINIHEALTYTTLAVEAGWQYAIPPTYFSVSGSQRTSLSLAAGISPLNRVTRSGSVTNNAPENDERMRAVADTVRKYFSPLSANGTSFIWRAGFNTMRKYPNGSALEMGLFYSGSYSAYFYGEGTEIMKSHIYIDDDEIDKPLSFLTSRIELKVTFLRPVNRKGKSEQ